MSTTSFSFRLFCLIFFIVPISLFRAQEKMDEHQSSHITHIPTDLKWTDGPASLPAGIKIAVLEGDLTKPGPFTFRVKFPANYRIPPHFHPGVEHVTVLNGSFYMGFGDAFDESKATQLPAGGFAAMQIGTHHYAFTKGETEIQIHSIGPWGITYVNSMDDPRNKSN
jgi:quercetin dioxygenase-like cupin family protein